MRNTIGGGAVALRSAVVSGALSLAVSCAEAARPEVSDGALNAAPDDGVGGSGESNAPSGGTSPNSAGGSNTEPPSGSAAGAGGTSSGGAAAGSGGTVSVAGTSGGGGTAAGGSNAGGNASGGTSAAGTSGGGTPGASGAGGTPSTGGPYPLGSTTGWVSGASNPVGIQGSFFTFSDEVDGGTSTISPDDYSTAQPDTICADGTAAQVVGGLFSQYWGAGIGFNPNQLAGDDTAYVYDAASQGVTGFSFTVTGPTVPPTLRLKFVVDGDPTEYCLSIAAGAQEVRFSDTVGECWPGGANAGAPDPSQITAVQWVVATTEASATPYDFCIEEFAALDD